MEKIFIFSIIFLLIIVLAMFFFISYMKIGIGKNLQDIRSELDRVSEGVPAYSPLGLSTAIARAIFSFISLFIPSS